MFISVEAQWSFSEGQYGTGISGNISTSSTTATHGTMSGVFTLNGTGEANPESQYYVMGEFKKSFSYAAGDFLMADLKLKNLSGAQEIMVSMYGKISGEYILLESHTMNSIWHTFSGTLNANESVSEILFILQTIGTSGTSVSAEVYIDNIRMQFGVGGEPTFEMWDSFGDSLTGVDDEETLYEFALHQNYPNPFNPSTQISYEIPQSSDVMLSIYSILGQKISDLVDTYQIAGRHTIKLDGSYLSSGMYIYTLKAGDRVSSRRMLLVK